MVVAAGLGLLAQPAPMAQASGDLEAQFAARVATERQARGLGALVVEDDLTVVARAHAEAMAAADRLFHNTLLGQQVQAWHLVAENVGMGSSVDQIHGALMASASHRADILDARFRGIGIGVAQSGASIWVTEVFRQPWGDPAQPAAAPRAVPVPAPVPSAGLPPVTDPAVAPTVADGTRSRPVERPDQPDPTSPTTVGVEATAVAATPPMTPAAPAFAPPSPTARHLALRTLAAGSPVDTTRSGLAGTALAATLLLWIVAVGVVTVAVRTRADA